jgi:hypothetical protein
MKQQAHPRRRAAIGTVLVVCAVALGVVVLQSGASRSPRAHAGAAAPSARPATLHALGDLAPGMALGPYQVRDVSEPIDGAVLVRATSPTGEIIFEVRLLSDRPLPAAKTGTYAVYYRGTDGGADVLAGAAALATALERAAKSAPLPGLTQYPTVFTSL